MGVRRCEREVKADAIDRLIRPLPRWSIDRLSSQNARRREKPSYLPIVRHARGEGWAIVESVLRLPLTQLQGLIEGVDLLPIIQSLLLLAREHDLVVQTHILGLRHGRSDHSEGGTSARCDLVHFLRLLLFLN